MSGTGECQGLETSVASTNATMLSYAFQLGFLDFKSGIPFPADVYRRIGYRGCDWHYERGRLYAAAGGAFPRLTRSGRFVVLEQRRFYEIEDGII